MLTLSRSIVRHRRAIMVMYAILIALSLYYMPHINVDYDISTALPTNLPSIKAMAILRNQMQVGEPVNIYWKNAHIKDVAVAVENLQDMPAVKSVSWLGTFEDTAVPVEFWSQDTSEWVSGSDYNIVVQTSATSGSIDSVLAQIKSVLPSNAYVISTQEQIRQLRSYFTGKPALYLGLGILLVALFLLIYFDKPLTPMLIVASMATAVILNMGISGFLRQHVFYVVRIIVEILQLAVSYDYGLFLYHRYEEEKKSSSNEEAMAVALRTTIKAVALAALTTLAGFGALTVASLEISKQIGWLLLRGVTISFLVSVTLLPALLLDFEGKLRWKTMNLENVLANLSALVEKAIVPLFIAFLVVGSLAFWGSEKTLVSYSNDFYVPKELEFVKINKEFQRKFQSYDTWMVVLENTHGYSSVLKRIQDLPLVRSVVNPVTLLDPAIPPEMVPSSVLESFSSGKYVYATIYTKVKPDTPEAGQLRSQIDNILSSYPGEQYVTGLSIVMDDIKHLSMVDNTKTTWITLVLIFALLFLGFRNILLSLALIAVIEVAIHLNLWMAGLAGAVTFMVPITLSTVQLGSTIDYAVLTATRFEEAIANKVHNPLDVSIRGAAPSIFVSAGTFFLMSLPTALLSDIPGLSQIMGALSRGALISGLAVILFIPPIFKTLETWLFGRREAQ